MTTLSVIIPLAPDEQEHTVLLAALPDGPEVILSQKAGRVASLNAGAVQARGEYLWFLHADSRVSDDTLPALRRAIERYPNSLLFFDLVFSGGASPLMHLNAWGVRFRSRVLGIPFGDQGLCLRKDLFHRLGGFPEGLEYGEDHVFVWQARQQGIPIQPVGATLRTSARKYNAQGWLRTTCRHQYLWIKQAWPEWRKLRKNSLSSRT